MTDYEHKMYKPLPLYFNEKKKNKLISQGRV